MRAESNCPHSSNWKVSYAAIRAPKQQRAASLLRSVLIGLIFICLLSIAAYAQGNGQAPTSRPAEFEAAEKEGNGRQMDGYFVRQSVELGGRITEITGSPDMYNTIVNLQSGPRLLEQSLILQAMPGHKSFFDTLYEESFGWGGDPSNAMRLRVSKHGVYSFTGSFRRDQNFFNYNLLANPLNPVAPFIGFSPHATFLRRRMYDFDLVVLPQHKFSFNLGFSRNRNEGPSFSSVHEGTEALLLQAYSTTENNFRFGASWRVLPRTTLSFNESLRFIKYDTDYFLDAADLPPSGILSTGAGLNTFNSYSRLQRYRNYLPTEQATLTSSSIRHVDLTARFMYSNADATTPLAENFTGLVTRTGVNAFNTNGSTARPYWVSQQADGGATIHITPHLRLVDTFRFYAYRVPGAFNLLENNFFAVYTANSPADVQNELFQRFMQQSIKSNEFSVQFDISRHVGVRAGYLFRDIFDNHTKLYTALGDIFLPGNTGVTNNCLALGLTLDLATGTCTGVFDSDEGDPEFRIHQHWAIFGVWFRGSRFHADAEGRIMSADDFLTRIDPRREQQYRANVSFTPESWLTLTASVNLREQRNRTQDFAYNANYRNFGFSAVATPNKRVMVELAYNYTNAGQNANVCYASSAPVAGTFACVNDPTLLEVLGRYENQIHFGSANVQFRPVRRFVVGAGYSIVDSDGNTLLLNSLEPLGSLSSRYQQPLAFVGAEVARKVELRAGWNYYQYNENSLVGPTLPRYFHANLTTLSLRYAF